MMRTFALSFALAGSALGQVRSLNLSNYVHTATFDLPPVEASEASAVTYNWDTGSLFVLGDEGEAIVEVSRQGALLSSMSLSGFDDTEGLTYVGGGRFVLVEERLQDAFELTYTPGGSVARSSLPGASLGPTVGNVGLEGISFDPRDGRYVVVKEKSPQAVLGAEIDFNAGAAVVSALFDPAGLGVLDLSDVQVLSVVPSLAIGRDADGLLIYSQESSRLMEVSRDGLVLSTFDFGAISSSAEGVTIDGDGVIYICDEGPRLYVLAPIPAPGAGASLLIVAGMASRRRR